MSRLSRCHCLFPSISYPGTCEKCQLSHEEAEKMVLKAMDVPYIFFANGLITWQQHEELVATIDRIVWKAYRGFKKTSRNTFLGEKTVLCHFQEYILKQVRTLMYKKHGLLLHPQDEKIFRQIDTVDFLCEKMRK